MKDSIASFLRLGLLVVLLAGLALPPQSSVYAAAVLQVEPITWNIIGLDSNNVSVGPNHFPIGARVCNTGDAVATNVQASFVWDSVNPYINLRPGTAGSGASGAPVTLPASGTIDLPFTPGSNCTEFYFEVEVARNSAAYDTTRRYHIAVTADGGITGSTPTPRELYVEHLVSQSRNAVTDVQLDGKSIPAGGTMTLAVGNSYTITLVGYTATQGYNQLESFINFPNTIFQVDSVTSTFTSGTSPIDTLYADACGWDNVPSSATYRSCIGSDAKSGGNVTVTYDVTILKVPGAPLVNPEPLSTLLYDFSGSSYHYNSDYGISTRFAQIIDPASAVTISKAFSPSTIPPGGSSTLTVTLTNTSAATISGANFSDTLPILSGSQMVVATPATFSSSGCGSAPTLVFAPAGGQSGFSVAGATIAPNGSCTLSVGVSVPSTPTTGIYPNQVTNFRVGSSPTAGITSNTANLTVNAAAGSAGTGICGLTMATWTFPGITSNFTPNPAATLNNLGAGNALASAGAGIVNTGASASPFIRSATHTTDGSGSWSTNGLFDSIAALATANNDYFEFALNTTGYTSVDMNFWALSANGNAPEQVVVYSGTAAAPPGTIKTTLGTPPGTTFPGTITWASSGIISFPAAQLNAAGFTYFRVYGAYAKNNNPGSDLYIDDVAFTGCRAAEKPILTKTFNTNPVVVNGTSTLTFTLTNPNIAPLTGAKFTDDLPSGLQVAATPNPSTTCGGAPTWAPTAGATTLSFGQTTGATIPASGSCTVSVDVIATTAGPHPNVSGFISSTESGTNSTSTGSATASLVAVLPPMIEKVFNPNPILPGQSTTLTFTITNPNPGNALPNVAFTDTFPITPGSMVVAATPNASTAGCGTPTFAPVAGAGSISFADGTIAAGGECTIKVDVTVPVGATGSYANTTSAVTTTVGGQTRGTDTASATLMVNPPNPEFTLSKQISTNASGPWSKFLTVVPGNTIYYRFTLENTGDVPLTLTAPVLNDLNVNTAGCTWPATLPVASPTSDPTATCTVSVTAAAGDHPNTATASASYGGNTYSSTSSADYFGAAAGLNLLKQISTSASGPWSDSITGVTPGSNIYYRFTVVNTSLLVLSNITVVDPQVSAAGCAFTSPLSTNNATSCVVGPVTAALSGATPFANTAHATGENGGTTYPSPDSTATYTLALPSLGLSKSNSVAAVIAGGTTTYSLMVSNSGSSSTSGLITVVDVLPAGLSILNGTVTLSGANAADWSCTAASNVLTCTSNITIAASGTSVFSFIADVAANATGTLLNKAQVGGGGDTQTSTPTAASTGNCTGADTPVKGCAIDGDTVDLVADLSITKTDNSATYVPGTAIGYTVVVTNNGIGPATNATVVDAIPANVTGATWTCSASTGSSCTAGGSGNINDTVTIPAGGNVTYTVIGLVSSTATGSLSNAATVTAPVGTTDPVPGNNSATDTNTAAACVSGPFTSWTFTGNNMNAATGAGLFTYDTLGLNPPTWPVSQVAGDTPAISFTGAQNADYTANIDYVDFAVPTNGRGAISMSFIDYRSGTGPDSFVIYYSTDGATYNALPPGTIYAIANTAWTSRSIDFSSITALNNNSTAHFRAYPYRAAAGGSGLGTWRLDNVSFSGDCLADVAVTKTLDTAAPYTVGQSLTYTLTVSNNGPFTATGISVADMPTNLTITNVTSPTMTCTGSAFPCILASLANGASATITVTATINAPGAFDNSATVTSTSPDPNTTNGTDNTGNGGTALPTINAVDDNFSATPVDSGTGGTTASVIVNDTTNGVAAVIGTNVSLNPGSAPTPAVGSITMNADGTITVAAGTTAGTYTYPYTICTIPGTTPSTCDTANATVVVAGSTITANDDTATIAANTPVTTVVTTNDTTVGGTIDTGSVAVVVPPTTGSVVCTAASCEYTPPAGFIGTVTYTYQVCLSAPNATVCDTADVTITVTPTINAVDDNYGPINGGAGGTTASVIANDTTNGVAAVIGTNVALTPGAAPTPTAGSITMNADGTITVAAGTTAGTYNYPYTICTTPATIPATCDSATAIIIVAAPTIAANDDTTTTPANTPVTTVVTTNDTNVGGSINTGSVTVTVPPATGSVICTGSSCEYTPPAGFAGTATYTYQVCLAAPYGSICDTAVVTISVTSTIDAINDDFSATPVNGGNGGSTASVITNDTTNGVAAVIGTNVTLTPGAAPTPAAGSLTMDPATGIITVAAGTTPGTYTYPYTICTLPATIPATCDTANATIVVAAATINAVDDAETTPANTPVTTVVTTNDTNVGGSINPASVTVTVPPATGSVVCTGASCEYTPPAGFAGTTNYTYQVCLAAPNASVCDTAVVTVTVTPTVNATNDTYGPINGFSGGTTASVLGNDTTNDGTAAVGAGGNTALTPGAAPTPASGSITMNADGTITLAAGTTAGTYTYPYQICTLPATIPATCDSAVATVTVSTAPIVAVDNSFTVPNGVTGGTTASVLGNDTLNGGPVTVGAGGNVTLTPGTAPTPASGSITINPDGTITVSPDTTAGTYNYPYTICDVVNPTNCDTAIATVIVGAAPIDAVDDTYGPINGFTGSTTATVLANDTLNGAAVTVGAGGNATLTPGAAPTPTTGSITMNGDGTITVAAGTTAGTYTYPYTICEMLNPVNCDIATATITVGSPAINAINDDYSGTPIDGVAGGNVGNAFTNDTLNGAAVAPAQITATVTTAASDPGVTLNLTTGSVDVAAGTPAGTYTITYQICENTNPTNCDSATITVRVNPPASISGVVFHDADLNGTKASGEAGLGSVTVNLYDSTGTTLIATTTTGAGGMYNFPSVTPGSYTVVEVDPAGYVSSTSNNVPVTIAAGGSGVANFGDYQLPNTALSSISGIVYEDANANGTQDAGEPPLSGVTVELRNNVGTVIGTFVTGATGAYSFTSLAAGTYTVTETDLAGYTSTTLNQVAVNLSAGTNVTVHFGDQTGAAVIADPAVTKLGSPTNAVVGDTVVYTITVGNTGTVNATNVILTDTKPAFLDIIAITIAPNPGLTPVISGNTFTINVGTVTPTDFYTITVLTRVNSLGVPPGGANTARLSTTSATDRLANNATTAGLTITVSSTTSVIPHTGFAPHVITEVMPQPQELKYAATDVILEIPSLGIKLPVVGVPKKNGAWDVTWLGDQAGWLEGTAFPSWKGNSVLTSHVYLSNGLPGPFVNLGKLKYGEKVVVHAYGQKYTFEVRTNEVVDPNNTSVLKHEEKPWLTLVTCKEYDEKTNTYKKRVVVRTVLVKVEAE